MNKKLNVSLSWFLRFWPTNMSLFCKLTKIWNFSLFVFISKIYELQRLKLHCYKAFDQKFCPSKYDMALGVWVLGLEDKVSMHGFFTQNLCIFTVSTFRGSKKGSFYLSLLIFLQKGQKNWRKPAYWANLSLGGHYLVVTLYVFRKNQTHTT